MRRLPTPRTRPPGSRRGGPSWASWQVGGCWAPRLAWVALVKFCIPSPKAGTLFWGRQAALQAPSQPCLGETRAPHGGLWKSALGEAPAGLGSFKPSVQRRKVEQWFFGE
jgi:hypothetical protein